VATSGGTATALVTEIGNRQNLIGFVAVLLEVEAAAKRGNQLQLNQPRMMLIWKATIIITTIGVVENMQMVDVHVVAVVAAVGNAEKVVAAEVVQEVLLQVHNKAQKRKRRKNTLPGGAIEDTIVEVVRNLQKTLRTKGRNPRQIRDTWWRAEFL